MNSKTNSKRGGARPGAGRKSTRDIIRAEFERLLSPENRAYEAAERYNSARHYIWTPTLDARQEFTEGDRLELARKAWWLYNNHAMCRRAVDSLATLVVGSGLVPKPCTSNGAWNAATAEHLQVTVNSTAFAFDAAAQVDLLSAQHFIIRHVALSGDLFYQLVLSEAGSGMVKFVPGEFVGNSSDSGLDQKLWHDGVMADPATLRPLKYRVLEAPRAKGYKDISADDIKIIRAPHRLGYLRSPSWLTPAIDTMQDIAETNSFTKQAQKLAAQMGIIVESPEATRVALGSAMTGRNAIGNSAESPNGTGMTLDRLFPGVGTTQLKPGEKVQFLKNEHPSELFVPFIKFQRDEVAYAFGLPPEMLFADTGLTGPAWRKILVESQAALERLRSWLKSSFLTDYYRFRVWHEIEAGRLDYVEDWARVEWTEPADQTIDFGRDMRAILEMQAGGSISPERAAELGGYDAHNEEDRIISAAVRRRQKILASKDAQALGLTYSDIFGTEKQQAASGAFDITKKADG